GGCRLPGLRPAGAGAGPALRVERPASRPGAFRRGPRDGRRGARRGRPMKQVLLKEGKAILEEVPVPSAEPGRVLVRTAFSVLSAGTERAALHAGEAASLLGRATDPATVRKAIEILRSEGPSGLFDRVRAARESRAAAPRSRGPGGRASSDSISIRRARPAAVPSGSRRTIWGRATRARRCRARRTGSWRTRS